MTKAQEYFWGTAYPTIAQAAGGIDKLREQVADLKAELVNVLDSLIAVQDQNTKIVREYTMAYKELLELRDQRDDLYTVIDRARAEITQLRGDR